MAQALSDRRPCRPAREKRRLFGKFRYAAGTWERPRRVIVKAEHAARGANPRYIVTNLEGAPQRLYDKMYCARGDMENRIKEQQLELFADRTSCSEWWPNQYRLLLSSLTYVLLESTRRIALAGGDLARAYVGTVRLKLLKVGTVVAQHPARALAAVLVLPEQGPVFRRRPAAQARIIAFRPRFLLRAVSARGSSCPKSADWPRPPRKQAGNGGVCIEIRAGRPGSRPPGAFTPRQGAKTTAFLPNQIARAISGLNIRCTKRCIPNKLYKNSIKNK